MDVEPSVTFPNAMLIGEAASTFVTNTPVPLTEIDNWLSDAFDVIVTDPVTLPVTLGENATVSCVVAPAASENGAAMPVAENPLPVVVTPEMDTPADPVFVS